MAKLNFIYLGKDWYGNPKENLPKGEITAIKVKFSDDKMHYVPIIPSSYESVEDVKEVFVRREKGWVKIKGRKKYTLPVYDGTIEHFSEYLEEYGDDVMCYCLNGSMFNRSGDCCDIDYCNEYRSLKRYGAETYNEFALHFNKLIEYQKEWFNEHHLPIFKKNGYNGRVVERFLFKPDLALGIPFFGVPTLMLDVIGDDKKMETLYGNLRFWELNESIPKDVTTEKESFERYNKIRKIIDNERENDTPQFPQQMKERIKVLFGEKAQKEYTYLMDKFVKK